MAHYEIEKISNAGPEEMWYMQYARMEQSTIDYRKTEFDQSSVAKGAAAASEVSNASLKSKAATDADAAIELGLRSGKCCRSAFQLRRHEQICKRLQVYSSGCRSIDFMVWRPEQPKSNIASTRASSFLYCYRRDEHEGSSYHAQSPHARRNCRFSGSCHVNCSYARSTYASKPAGEIP